MPADTLRRALRRFRRDQARAHVARFRGLAEVPTTDELMRDHPFLCGDSALEVLGEAEESGALPKAEAWAMRLHLADIRALRELGRVRRGWANLPQQVVELRGDAHRVADVLQTLSSPACKLGSEEQRERAAALSRVAAEIAPRVEAAGQRASEARAEVLAGHHVPQTSTQTSAIDPGAAPESPAEALATPAAATPTPLDFGQAWLDATDDLFAECQERVFGAAEDLSDTFRWAAWLPLGAFPDLAGSYGARERARRVVAPLSSLGFERELNAIRVEPPHASVGLEVHLAMLDSRLDLRLSASTRELGLASDLALAHGLGRALGHALVPAALPFAQAHSVTPDGPRMLAELLTQLQLDPVYLASRRLSASERAQAALGGVTLLLLRSRVASAAVVARAAASSDAVSSLSRRACGVPLPLPLARLLLAGDLGPPARISASLQALRFATSLRDALDEDWFRNPRSAEVLRASLGSWAQTSEVALPGVDERGLDLSDARLGASRLGELLHA